MIWIAVGVFVVVTVISIWRMFLAPDPPIRYVGAMETTTTPLSPATLAAWHAHLEQERERDRRAGYL